MKFVDFKKSLNDYISPIYIFYGNDRFLIENSIKNLTNACEISMPELNMSTFSDEINIENVLTACETLPFMDKLRLNIVKDIDLNENILSKIQKYAENPNKSACLAVIAKNDIKIEDNDNIKSVDCNKLDANMIRKKIVSDLKIKGYLIGDEAIKVLIEYCDYSLTQINVELEKLMAYASDTKTITADMVKTLTIKDINYNIFELTEAISQKQINDAVHIMDYLLENEEPTTIISLLYNYFRRLFIVSITPNDVDNTEIANSIQVKPYAITIAKKQAKSFDKNTLLNLCKKLQEIDIRIKNNFSNPKNEIYAFLFLALDKEKNAKNS